MRDTGSWIRGGKSGVVSQESGVLRVEASCLLLVTGLA